MKMRQNTNAEYLGVKNIAKKFMECQENWGKCKFVESLGKRIVENEFMECQKNERKHHVLNPKG